MSINILIPWTKSKWAKEIKFCLRSWEKNFKNIDDAKFWILGEELPSWIKQGVEFVAFDDTEKTTEQTHGEKLAWAVNNLKDFIYTNDDIYLTRPIGLSRMKKPFYLNDLTKRKIKEEVKKNTVDPKRNRWGKLLHNTIESLVSNDDSLFNGETHTPYWYDSIKVKEVMGKYPILEGKALLRTAYINNVYAVTELNRLGYQKAGFYRRRASYNLESIAKATYLNHDDKGLTKSLKRLIACMFKTKSTLFE